MKNITKALFFIGFIALGSALIMCLIGISYQMPYRSTLGDCMKVATIFGMVMMLFAFILFIWNEMFNE
jgi:hypothetical protein